jgi:pSer/pThr/pTyr-binding forkhead associated (FHA) protein/tetratricopeptide (TPR) repeat protein
MSGRRIEILVRRQGQPDRRVTLEQGTYQVGRAEDNALVLPDIAVSRRHARITVTSSHVLVEDVGSGNGTYLHGRPIRRQEVTDADEVLIDPFLLVFSVPPVTEAPEEAASAGGGPRLDVLTGQGMRATYPLSGVGLTLGRSEQRDVVLPDPSASRKHAEVFQQDGRWYLRDFGSINGTWVNDQRIREHALQDGDHIRIGNVELRYLNPAPGTDSASPRPLASVVFAESRGSRPGPQLPPGAVVPPTAVALGIAEPPITSTPLPVRPSMATTAPPTEPPPAGPEVPDGLQPTSAIPRAAILSSAAQGPGGPPRPGSPSGVPSFPQAPTAPPPETDPDEPPSTRPSDRPPGTVGGFGTGVLTVPARSSRTSGFGTPGGAAARSGSFLERNVRWLTIGIGLLAVALIAYKVIRDRPGDTSGPWTAPKTSAAVSEATAITVAGLLEEGNTHFRNRRYVEAVEKYAAVQKLDPQNPMAVKMGYHACEFLVIRSLGDDLTRRSTSLDEQRAAYVAAMAAARAALAGTGGPLDDAIQGLESTRAFFPDDAPLTDLLARLEATQRGRARATRRAEQETTAATVSDLYASAQALAEAGDLAAAIPGFEAVLAADPERETEFFARAEERIRESKVMLADRGREVCQQGVDAVQANDPLAARARFRDCLRQDPYNRAAERSLAEVQQTLDRLATNYWTEAEIFESSHQLEMAVARYRQVIDCSASSAAPLAQKARTRIDALLR